MATRPDWARLPHTTHTAGPSNVPTPRHGYAQYAGPTGRTQWLQLQPTHLWDAKAGHRDQGWGEGANSVVSWPSLTSDAVLTNATAAQRLSYRGADTNLGDQPVVGYGDGSDDRLSCVFAAPVVPPYSVLVVGYAVTAGKLFDSTAGGVSASRFYLDRSGTLGAYRVGNDTTAASFSPGYSTNSAVLVFLYAKANGEVDYLIRKRGASAPQSGTVNLTAANSWLGLTVLARYDGAANSSDKGVAALAIREGADFRELECWPAILADADTRWGIRP